MFNNQIIAGAAGQGGGFYPYSIENSLRFNDGDTAYLSRTPASAGNLDAWTFSAWVKRSNIGIATTIFSAQSDVSNWMYIGFLSGNTLTWQQADAGSVTMTLTTSQLFRDVGSWYHIVCKYDSAQATAADRQEIYINGSKVTAFGTATRLGQNVDSRINRNIAHQIGRYISAANYFDGYMAEVNFIDGTALDATSFGETINGVWVPKAYSGSYGTNGFYLPFDDSAAIGDDESGNTNDWTANNLAASDVVPDSPTNNFATLNRLSSYSTIALSEGSLKASETANVGRTAFSSIALQSGKWYFEAYVQTAGTYVGIGLSHDGFDGSNYTGNAANTYGYLSHTGDKYTGGVATSYGATFTSGDIVSAAFDATAGTLTFYKNGVSQGTAFTSITLEQFFTVTSRNGVIIANFGQDSTFAGATTAGGNADDNGIGDFKYAPPSGFLALCSANLPEPTISPNAAEQADDYFNTVLYTGNGTGQSITTGHASDFVWLKTRALSYQHSLYDSVRGGQYRLASDQALVEVPNASANLQSFDANGFTVGTLINDNTNGQSYVGWSWKAGGAAGSNTDGSITSSVSAAPDAGFSIVGYTGTGANATVGHGLSSAPEFTIVKGRDVGRTWATQHKDLSGGTYYIGLETTNPQLVDGTQYTGFPTNSVINVGTYNSASGEDYIAYCFHSSDICKVGSYVGNGSADGTFVYTGFRPAWVMIKSSSLTYGWVIVDTVRNTYNVVNSNLFPHASAAEDSSTGFFNIDAVSNGFKVRTSNAASNQSGGSYIYLAFAEAPFKYANAR